MPPKMVIGYGRRRVRRPKLMGGLSLGFLRALDAQRPGLLHRKLGQAIAGAGRRRRRRVHGGSKVPI